MRDYTFYTYMLTNRNNTVIYTGVTNDIERRMLEHKSGKFPGFTSKYNCTKLVWLEEIQWVDDAIAREKQIKAGSRQKKIDLINALNPSWQDLSGDWYTDYDIKNAFK